MTAVAARRDGWVTTMEKATDMVPAGFVCYGRSFTRPVLSQEER
ncbi:hypothetical protein [Kaistia sp. 32K]|nr:hypothetical protein [Kaistia sp. 32K]